MSVAKPMASYSIVAMIGASYALLAVVTGLVVVLTDGRGLVGVVAVGLLATLTLYYGRVVLMNAVRILTARRTHALGTDVRDTLAGLGSAFRVTRSICDELGREDHVVVGPTGVFVVVAADGDLHTGSERRLFADSRAWWRDMIEDCHLEALRTGERLRRSVGPGVVVQPVLCLRSGLAAVGRVVRGVRIVHMQNLVQTIADASPVGELDARRIERAAAALTTTATVIPLRPRARADGSAVDGRAPHSTGAP